MSGNPFGGANPHGLYVPMSETEMEAISRLVESDDLEVVIHGWGILYKPTVTFGDYRICIRFRLTFNAPAVPTPVHFLDLELRTRAGLTLYKARQHTVYGGQPMMAAAGVFVDMAWDIALHHIDPQVVKTLKPGAIGLTSRRLDKDTGAATLTGNMRTTSAERRILHFLKEGEQASRALDLDNAIKATKDAGHDVVVTDKGIKAPDL